MSRVLSIGVLSQPLVEDVARTLTLEYQAAADLKGYTYLGDYNTLYAKYQELILNGKIETDIYLVSPKYACKMSGDDMLNCLSLVKILGEYPEFEAIATITGSSVKYNSDYFRFDRGQLHCPLVRNYNKSSFRVKYTGSIDAGAPTNNPLVWGFDANIPVYLRKASETQLRWLYYNQANTLLAPNRTETLNMTNVHTVEEVFTRNGDTTSHAVFYNGSPLGSNPFVKTGMDGLINGMSIRIARPITSPALLNIYEFEIEFPDYKTPNALLEDYKAAVLADGGTLNNEERTYNIFANEVHNDAIFLVAESGGVQKDGDNLVAKWYDFKKNYTATSSGSNRPLFSLAQRGTKDAIYFNSQKWLQTNHHFQQLRDGFTMAFWVNSEVHEAGFSGAFTGFNSTGGTRGRALFRTTQDRLYMQFVDTTGTNVLVTISTSIQLIGTGWNFMVLTYVKATKTISFYLNGIFEGSKVMDNELATATPSINMYIGTGAITTHALMGYMDYFAIWDRELSQTEINYLYSEYPKYQVIDALVQEYQAAATAKGYDYVGDYDALYEKYEELVNTDKLTGKSYIVSTDYAYKLDGTDITAMLSLTKDGEEYNEIIQTTNAPILEDGYAVISKAGLAGTRGLTGFELNYNQDSFYIEIEGEMFYNSAIFYWLSASSANGSTRQLINTNNRQYTISYNEGGTSVGSNSGNDYYQTDGSYVYRTEYVRDGNSCLVRLLRNGVLIYSHSRTWDGLTNMNYFMTGAASVTFKAKRIEVAKL
jgi:hypothetical protein